MKLKRKKAYGMKKIGSVAAILMAGLLCMGLFAGCSEEESNSSSESSSSSSSSTSSTSSSEVSSETEEETGDVIGQITYIGSSTLVLDVYEPDSEITDYTDLGDIALTDAEQTQSVSLEEDAVYQSVADGTVNVIALDDLAEEDMVAVTTDEDGVQTIIVLDVEIADEDLSSDEDSSALSESSEITTEESALEEAAGDSASE